VSDVAVVGARAANGPVSVEVSAPTTPHNVTGIVWRYDPQKQPKGAAGEFSHKVPTVPLGAVSSIHDNFYLIEGVVLNMNDNPPVHYQVVVSVLQQGATIHQQVPTNGGAGEIGSADVPFVYRFQIVEAP